MFEIEKDNAKIGKHLKKLILSKHKNLQKHQVMTRSS